MTFRSAWKNIITICRISNLPLKKAVFMLQCRVGKRNGPAAVRMAMDMLKEKLTKKEEVVTRVTPAQLDELLHPIIDPKDGIDQ